MGLSDHIHKKPNQLSGGQMQRVAIARALVNNPEIILADEPTGALDSDTSVSIMKILKKVSRDKLVIMVTHNPDLALEYSSRIINIKDGRILSDSNAYDGGINTKEEGNVVKEKSRKTKMSYITAFMLSLNNLLTKKGRTVLVSIAGSIGIIGIALILAVSTGFQNYVDSIQEDTLTSYPLNIMQESADITGTLLSMREGSGDKTDGDTVVEQQYVTSMMSNVSTNDLKSLKKYIHEHNDFIRGDLSNIQYFYSVDPNIYTVDASQKLAKVNPSNLFSSMMGFNSLMGSYSSMASIFSQMVDNRTEIQDDYVTLAGRWPSKYDEMMIVLSEANSISDLLVYSLGLRDTEELTSMVTKIMSGESVDIHHDPLTLKYDDLMNVDLRLIMPSDTYQYNHKYDVYEDMSENDEYMRDLYDKALKLKIVGVVTTKDGVSSSALNPGVVYTSDLISHIISYSSNTEVVQKQLNNKEVDVFSGNRFDSKKNDYNFEFADLVRVDSEKLQSAFDIHIDEDSIRNETNQYMEEISNSISVDVEPAREMFYGNIEKFSQEIFNSNHEFFAKDIEMIVDSYLNTKVNIFLDMEREYVIPSDTFKTTYKGFLTTLLGTYASGYNVYMKTMDPNYDSDNSKVVVVDEMKDTVISQYLESAPIQELVEKMAQGMTEARVKRDVLLKVGELVSGITGHFANAFHVDEEKITSAFTLNFSEDELARVVNAMMNPTETTQKTNLISLGYQDMEEPTYISFYFSSFEGKEHFLKFLDDYNKSVSEDKKINFSDTTGILMSSVKTIVNAVSYVLIAFVSISLVVSSIMIGVITYISVYERTKEIGILRAIGASKRNISSIFNAETFIIGLLSGMFGIGISYLFIPIINRVLHHFIGNIPLSAKLNVSHAIILVVLAIILTIIGGFIPAKSASRKDPVEALRSE